MEPNKPPQADDVDYLGSHAPLPAALDDPGEQQCGRYPAERGLRMTESISPARRSWIMSRVAAKNTPAELRVRKVAHSLGLRFRLHRADLPGMPDIVFPKYRVAVFVHGCFWHRHPGCKRTKMPKTNQVYWRKKFKSNTVRDRRVMAEMISLGWRALVFWECETCDPDAIARRLHSEIVGRRSARLLRQKLR
jgi:DNA mismatch endonuclease (patch repair protein)